MLRKREYPCSLQLPCGHWILAELPRETGPTLFEYYCPVDGWMDGYETLVWHPAFRPGFTPWKEVNSEPVSDVMDYIKSMRTDRHGVMVLPS